MEDLEDLENKVLGKLIGFINGMDEFVVDEDLINKVKNVCLSLKTKEDLRNSYNRLVDLKRIYLPNCLTCSSPCGRTNDYSLNDIINPIKKEDRLKEYREYISNFDINEDFKSILYHISKLSW